MKKILQKMIAWVTGTALAAIPLLAATTVTYAENTELQTTWLKTVFAEGDEFDYVSSDIPLNYSFNSAVEDQELINVLALYVDIDEMLVGASEELKKEAAEEDALHTGMIGFSMYACYNFVAGDTFTVNFTYPVNIKNFKWGGEEQWKVQSLSPSSVTFVCTATGDFSEDAYWLSFMIDYDKSSPQDQFWFKPMKTQLNIAAEVAEQTGKETVAEATGDFALSYEIMKWLEDHPNVTLKYTLTYKDKEYNIVIKGGQKLAFPDIPWYGPEYLIGKFLQ